MADTNEKLVSWLFETNAVRVCPEDKPFWYTSGTIGPYYINTHFLYGSEGKANELLKLIDQEKEDKYGCPLKVLQAVRDNYSKDAIFKALIDEMTTFIKNNIPVDQIEYISGGERRDWFFSLMIADLLDIPHITIYKDLSMVLCFKGKVEPVNKIHPGNVLHIADLITEASSYERAWIPAVRNTGAEIKWSMVVVDRKQGGEELLDSYGVKSYSMANIDIAFFQKALDMGFINEKQYDMILQYIDNPKKTMNKFLQGHPEFLKNALEADPKTRERALLCIEKNNYDIREEMK